MNFFHLFLFDKNFSLILKLFVDDLNIRHFKQIALFFVFKGIFHYETDQFESSP